MPDLDMLESRIAALEVKILGNNKKTEVISSAIITDSLLQAHTMISSALSCRDSINAVMDRMVTIDDYLDPMYVAQMIDVECKMTYVLELKAKLKESYEQFKTFNKLQGMLDSENINRVIDQEERVKSASVESSEVNELCMINTRNVVRILKGYNDMMKNIKLLFRQMSILLTNLESGEQKVLISEE